MNNKKIYTVGLIGCGRIAKVHADAIRHIQGFKLGAVCDIDEAKGQSFARRYNVPCFSQYVKLIDEISPDLVAIATPNGSHYQIAKGCFEKGVNILLEKPITIHTWEAEDLIKMAKKRKCSFFAVKQVRYNPSIRVLKSALDEGWFGKVYSSSLVVRWTRPQAYFDGSDWRGTKDMDGGGLLNQGIHYVDIMQWLVGDVESVFGRVELCCHKIEIEDLAYGLFKFKSGALGSVEFTINTYPHNLECSLAVLGDMGSAKLAGTAMNEIEIWEVRDLPKPVIPEGFPPYVYEEGLYQGSCPNHAYVYQDILRILNGKSSSSVDGEEAIHSLKVVNALYESSRTGKEVKVK
jgi:predicted dehydrogenase